MPFNTNLAWVKSGEAVTGSTSTPPSPQGLLNRLAQQLLENDLYLQNAIVAAKSGFGINADLTAGLGLVLHGGVINNGFFFNKIPQLTLTLPNNTQGYVMFETDFSNTDVIAGIGLPNNQYLLTYYDFNDPQSAFTRFTSHTSEVLYQFTTLNGEITDLVDLRGALRAAEPKDSIRNKVINGDFSIAARWPAIDSPISVNSSTLGIMGSGAYVCPDRFCFYMSNSGIEFTVTRKKFANNGDPKLSDGVNHDTFMDGRPLYYLEVAITTPGPANSYIDLAQPIENNRVLAGRGKTWSAYLKSPDALPSDTVRGFMWERTGSSPKTRYAELVTPLTSDWLYCWKTDSSYTNIRNSLSVNIDESNNYDGFGVGFRFPASSAKTFHITLVQVNEGMFPLPFDRRPQQVEQLLCARHYEKTYVDDVAPGTPVTMDSIGCSTWVLNGAAMHHEYASTNQLGMYGANTRFKAAKYSTPTIKWYSAFGEVNSITCLEAIVAGETQSPIISTWYTSKECTGMPVIAEDSVLASIIGDKTYIAYWTAESELIY